MAGAILPDSLRHSSDNRFAPSPPSTISADVPNTHREPPRAHLIAAPSPVS